MTAGWLTIRLWLAFHQPYPIPFIHDEFGYLLEADTFAHGRLTNPPHPLGEFFESPHILIRPTYMAKYPPGSALFLAAGQVLFGSPYWGVILEGAAMIFAFTLMLTAWVSVPWAIATVTPIVLYQQPTMHWTYSYWGGAVAVTGAALVLFAIGRHIGSRRAFHGLPLALGWVLLFWTRPYEGGVFSLAALAIWIWRLRASGNSPRRIVNVLAFGSPILVFAFIWTGMYNRAVTGNALELPYVLHQKRYMMQPVFWFQHLRPEPPLNNARLVALHGPNGTEAREWRNDQGWRNQFRHVGDVFKNLAAASGPVAFLVILVPFAWRDWRVRAAAIITAAGVLTLYPLTFEFSHYAAPFSAAIALLAGCAAETIGGKRFAVAITCIAVACAAAVAYRWRDKPRGPADQFPQTRDALISRLTKLAGPQLVLVRYPHPSIDVASEWVFNRADIDAQKVVFAFDLGPARDAELLRYYAGRQPWLVTVDGKCFSVVRLPRASR